MSDKIVLYGNNSALKAGISQAIATRKLIEYRDVGDIVAAPVDEWVRAYPGQIKLTITFYNKQFPPFKLDNGQRLVRAIYNVPAISRTMLTWEQIKAACGGGNGYLWGRFRATANLDNGRQMQVYGGSDREAERRLKALLELSSAKILTLTVAEEKREGRRAADQAMYKETTRIYPAFCCIINSQKLIQESNLEAPSTGVPTLTGNFKRVRTQKIPLFLTQAPSNFQSIVFESLRERGIQ